MTELAPTTAPRPTVTPGSSTTFCPSQAPSSTTTGRISCSGWSMIGVSSSSKP